MTPRRFSISKMTERLFGMHHDDENFTYPSEMELLQAIDRSNERGLVTDEAAYMLSHLVRSFTREDEDLAGISDLAQAQMLMHYVPDAESIAEIISLEIKQRKEDKKVTPTPLTCNA